MAYTPPWQRTCDCRCIVHHRRPRTTYTEPDCACAITCATQPLTLVADRWGCALFLDPRGDLWHVPAIANGTWDWAHAAQTGTQPDRDGFSRLIENLLRHIAQVLATPVA
ncbi:hypothetical protein AWW66_25140 [Micromonospora rosaria]|uniref:Uncharacterized protein n=1 Tax=Micromonospora rosaria TaxID=47874 RepID=A0A136PLP1_9ACTN|nr:hypothetical protein [Micromonospora rosaria]KXK59283.1 hypothetical protein AWW66_25140 [Micromonospora rosaria]